MKETETDKMTETVTETLIEMVTKTKMVTRRKGDGLVDVVRDIIFFFKLFILKKVVYSLRIIPNFFIL